MTEPAYSTAERTKYIVVGTAAVLAFFAAYGFAVSRNAPVSASAAAASTASRDAGTACAPGGACPSSAGAAAAADAAPAAADGCTSCESAPANVTSGAAVVEGDVQRIAVDVSAGYFDPARISARAGVPIEISFGQGSGCMAEVAFADFDIRRDLTQGGAVITLPALESGEYDFACGMDMVYGVIVVE